MKVLVVDDDPAIREVLSAYLNREGYEVEEAADGATALLVAPRASLVVLDLLLPELNGWRVTEALTHDHPELPILILTACDGEDDRVLGLELGADDYVVKPFSPREVVARVRALLRRTGSTEELVYGDLRIVTLEHRAYLGDRELPLTRLEFELLLMLAQHPGMVWTRERLLERVWRADFGGLSRVVDVRIAALRKHLDDSADRPRFIETVHGVGYRFRAAR